MLFSGNRVCLAMELSRAMALAGLALITLSIIILAVFRAISWARTEAYVSQEGGSLLVYASARCTHSILIPPSRPGITGTYWFAAMLRRCRGGSST